MRRPVMECEWEPRHLLKLAGDLIIIFAQEKLRELVALPEEAEDVWGE